jgi:predicted metal-dependent phosphoesterase TrpH
MSEENVKRQEDLTEEIQKVLEQEEIYKMQRSRVNWMANGDRNTTYFHNYARARKKRNLIMKLKDSDGVLREENSQLKGIITNYFTDLFSSEVDATNINLLQKVKPRVSAEMNERLLAPFTEEEVKKALFAIGDFKAPETDGMHAIFFKKFWPLIGSSVTAEVLEALNTGTVPVNWNETAIVLIPKVNEPELITQFRPISLCNVMYKII